MPRSQNHGRQTEGRAGRRLPDDRETDEVGTTLDDLDHDTADEVQRGQRSGHGGGGRSSERRRRQDDRRCRSNNGSAEKSSHLHDQPTTARPVSIGIPTQADEQALRRARRPTIAAVTRGQDPKATPASASVSRSAATPAPIGPPGVGCGGAAGRVAGQPGGAGLPCEKASAGAASADRDPVLRFAVWRRRIRAVIPRPVGTGAPSEEQYLCLVHDCTLSPSSRTARTR